MQTFLPYSDFISSVQCLDNKRLGKQRVECLQILKALNDHNYGWQNHPIVKMWKDYQSGLILYGEIICAEWIKRGFNDNCLPQIRKYEKFGLFLPSWFGNESFHLSHQSNLVRKDPEHYRKYFPNVPDNLPYQWFNPAKNIWYTTPIKSKS